MRNITVKQYFNLKDSIHYDALLQFVKPDNNFLGKKIEIVSLPYTNVKYCINLMQKINTTKNVFELFNIIFDVQSADFYEAKVIDYFKAKNYIIAAFKLINENELRLSQGGSTDLGKWKMAGAEKLSPYDMVLPLDQLGERYSIYPMDLGMKPYSEIFYLMAMTKILNEVNKNYNKP